MYAGKASLDGGSHVSGHDASEIGGAFEQSALHLAGQGASLVGRVRQDFARPARTVRVIQTGSVLHARAGSEVAAKTSLVSGRNQVASYATRISEKRAQCLFEHCARYL